MDGPILSSSLISAPLMIIGEKLGLYKVAKFYYYPGFWEGGPMLMTLAEPLDFQSAVLHCGGDEVTLQVLELITPDPAVAGLKNDQALPMGDCGAMGLSLPGAQSGALATCSNEAHIHSPWLKVLFTKWKPTRPKG